MGDPNNLEVCFPLSSLEDLLHWTEPKERNWSKYVSRLSKRSGFSYIPSSTCDNLSVQRLEVKATPKTLLCHDMKGGYIDDKFVEGSSNVEAYKFCNWAAIDIFVYFSHCLVTIPPLGWINAGHLHGVPVLGTFITEWEPGKKLWESVLKDQSQIMAMCTKLTQICAYYGFDGYLINIENDMSEPWKLIDFVQMLKASLASLNENHIVIWYDSVILPSGELKWQNKLNHFNRAFFDSCDGIFLNYCWKEPDLWQSLATAGERRADVYVGVDVWGRGCYGGGGFNTNLALSLVRKYGLSAALFAPGWTHEQQTLESKFPEREALFWKLLSPYLYLLGPASLPFSTSFCQGNGQNLYEKGRVIFEGNWYNMNKQNYQVSELCAHKIDGCLSFYSKTAYSGGGCLLLAPGNHRHRLLVSDWGGVEKVVVSTVTKPLLESSLCSELILLLTIESPSGNTRLVSLLENIPEPDKLTDFVLAKCSGVEEVNCWKRRNFEVQLGESRILEDASEERKHFKHFLASGGIGIVTINETRNHKSHIFADRFVLTLYFWPTLKPSE